VNAVTLLIVDDEPGIRDTVAKLAQRLGYAARTLTAAGAEEAEEILSREPVDALITDLRMPGRSGIDLLRGDAVRRLGLRCALMTGYQEDVIDGVPLAELPIVTVLRKPFGMQQASDVFAALQGSAGGSSNVDPTGAGPT
jgi:two-component system, response regulator YesN